MSQRKYLHIEKPTHLARQLGVPLSLLTSTANSIEDHYKFEKITDKKGKLRDAYKPDRTLRIVQSKIKVLLDNIEYPISIQGGVKGKSIKSNAELHIKQKYVATFDIKKFFPSIDYHVVEQTFRKQKCTPDVSRLLTRLTTAKAHLAQGFITSPKIAGLILLEVDLRLTKLFSKYNLKHSFWIDDLAVSGNYKIKGLVPLIIKIFLQAGFKLHTDQKLDIKGKHQQQKVTGIVINEHANIPKQWRLKLRQELHICLKYGIENYIEGSKLELPKQVFYNYLYGRLHFLSSIKPNEKLIEMFDELTIKEDLKYTSVKR